MGIITALVTEMQFHKMDVRAFMLTIKYEEKKEKY